MERAARTAAERGATLLAEIQELIERAEGAVEAGCSSEARASLATLQRCFEDLHASAAQREAEVSILERTLRGDAAAREVLLERYGRSPVPLVALDRGGMVREANEAAAALFGAPSPEVMIGRGFLAVTRAGEDAVTAAAFEAHLRRLREREPQVATELSLRDARGRQIVVRMVSRPPRLTETDAPTVLLDVTDRNRLEAMRTILELCGARFGRMTAPAAVVDQVPPIAVPLLADVCIAALLEASGEPAHVASRHVDPALGVALARASAESIVNLPGIRAAIASARASSRTVLVDEFVPNEPLARRVGDLTFCQALGIESLLVAPMLARGEALGVLVLGVRAERAPFSPDDVPLAEEIARRAALAIDNGVLFRALWDANEAKDRFLAVLSHELRTPLTPVLTAVSGQLEQGVPECPRLASMLEMVQRNVLLEARLIDDLLDLTRISRGKLELDVTVVDAHRTIALALEMCRKELASKRQSLEVDLAAQRHHVRADAARLQQVLWNLLKNAVKFAPEGGKITIRTRDADGRFCAQVQDDGIGIEPEKLSRIFEPFAQADRNITRRFGGMGLGLAIARTIAQAHGGRLSAASDGAGRGALFTLELPAVDAPVETGQAAGKKPAPPAREAARGVAPEQARDKVEVLLVEDDEDTLEVTSTLLEGPGCHVTCAQSVAGAIEKARSKRFDVVVSDIGLPDGTGLDLMRELRERQGDLKGIALSGYGSRDDVALSKRAGFAVHLTKPVSFPDLESKIRELTH